MNPKAQGIFDFEWTPPPTDVGAVIMYVAANAAKGNQGVTGNRIHLQSFDIAPAGAPGVPTINEGGVVPSNTFSAEDGFFSNTFGTVFGVDLTNVTLTWNDAFVDGVVPTTLGGARVFYDGESAFISFVGEGDDFGVPFAQVNFVVPETNNKGNGMVAVEVETAGGRSAAEMVLHQALSPSFFPLVAPNVAAGHLDGTLVGPPGLIPRVTTREANPDDVILLFGTGFGATGPAVPVGMLPVPGAISTTVEAVTICFGDAEVTPLLAKIGGLQTQEGVTIRVGAP